MPTEDPSTTTSDVQNVSPAQTGQARPLKPKLASISKSCDYLGGVSRSKFYAGILPHLETVHFGKRHFVVVESMDQLIAETLTASGPSAAAPRTVAANCTQASDQRPQGRRPTPIRQREAPT
jgi:hypothetical protein